MEIYFSLADHNNEKISSGFSPMKCEFNEFHTFITQNRGYSPNTFKDGKRSEINSLNTINAVFYDIDKGLTIDEALQKISGFRSILITSRNHQKEKKREGKTEPSCDRFRLIFPLNTTLSPQKATYKQILQRIADYLKIRPYADPATMEIARFYFASPVDAFYKYTEGKVINWQYFDYQEDQELKTSYCKKNDEYRDNLYKNELPSNFIFEVKDGKKQRFADFEHLAIGQTAPVRCHNKTNHYNGDRNPSAFIGRHHNGTLMWNCSVCPETFFIKYPPAISKSNKQENGNNAEDREKFSLTITSAEEIMRTDIVSDPFIIEKMIPERAITALTADSGAGKSLISLLMAKHVAKGEPLFEKYAVKRQKTLILDLEMNKNTIVSRFQALVGEACDIDMVMEQPFILNEKDNYEWLKEEIIKRQYGFLIFDTISNIHNFEENSAKEMKELTRQMIRLINETGITILFLHHHRKLGKGESYGQATSRGSTEIIAKTASHLLLKQLTNEENKMILELVQHKSRSPERLSAIQMEFIYDKENNKTTVNFLGESKNQTNEKIKEWILNNLIVKEMSVKEILEKISSDGLIVSERAIRIMLSSIEKIKIRLGGKSGREKIYRLEQEEEVFIEDMFD